MTSRPKRRKGRHLIEYTIIGNPRPGVPYHLIRAIGIDLGVQDWARNRHVAVNPNVGGAKTWVLTDIETGAAMYTSDNLRFIATLASQYLATIPDRRWQETFEAMMRRRSEAVASGVVDDQTYICRARLSVREDETIEALS